jgi:hypothetical protein
MVKVKHRRKSIIIRLEKALLYSNQSAAVLLSLDQKLLTPAIQIDGNMVIAAEDVLVVDLQPLKSGLFSQRFAVSEFWISTSSSAYRALRNLLTASLHSLRGNGHTAESLKMYKTQTAAHAATRFVNR